MGKKREPGPSDSSAGSPIEGASMVQSSPEPSKKRKRDSKAAAEELEIDVNLPEPPSKKAARKAKKAKTKPESSTAGDAAAADGTTTAEAKDGEKQRSAHGIWIGNLPFSCDKTVLRVFFTRQGGIPDDQITRVHMPVPRDAGAAAATGGRPKPANKGFAYVDFGTKEMLDKAIGMSETLMTGRKVLIKDAKSFEGRPERATRTTDALGAAAGGDAGGKMGGGGARAGAAAAAANGSTKAPSKRVFVGNLGFDVTKDDLETHFAQAGEIEDVHMATFEDTGKCKGFAWVRFVELDAAEAAVKGFVFKNEAGSDDEDEEDDSDDDEEDDKEEEEEEKALDSDSSTEQEKPDYKKPATQKKTKKQKSKKAKKQKKRKWFINRLFGRPLRCEFAEDAASRYKKRFGKSTADGAGAGADPSAPRRSFHGDADAAADGGDAGGARPDFKKRDRSGDKDFRQEQRRKKHVDARTIRPGAALANAPRASGAIVEGKGKKISFD
ncbi:hypothetical protein MBLNU459_g0653t1 [Dothideomycetes sp. NU459]